MIFNEEKTTRIDYEKITIELMKTIRKECKDIRPGRTPNTLRLISDHSDTFNS